MTGRPVPCAPRGAHLRPTLSKHARERCAEMGVSHDTAIDIVYNASLRYQGNDPGRRCLVARSDAHPDYAVVYDPQDGDRAPRIVTVVFATTEDYDRDGTTYTPRETA